jgi:hypothetical protein
MEESQALVRFVPSWVEDGVSEDGLPRYRETVRIIKSVPPHTEVYYEATEADFDDYPGPYQLFLREQGARTQEPTQSGFPLALWPVISPAQFKALTARGITTIEQLAKTRPDQNTPGEFKALIERAKQMLALSANIGKFEAMLRDRDGQIEALIEQVADLKSTVSAQNSLINTLKMKAA